MSDWSNEDILNFLECYQAEPCIWDPGNTDHKDKKKVADAWCRLSAIFNKPVKELKSKKEILMVTFRKHLKKKQDCIRSGAGTEDIYEPTWFAYKLMESFLLPIYTVKLGLNSETQPRLSETTIDESIDETGDTENENSLMCPSTSAAAVSAPVTQKSTDKSRRRPTSDLAEQQMSTAFSQLTNALSKRQSNPSDIEDECDLYGKLLAKKIRELPSDERKLIMYEIDGLFIRKIKQRSFSRDTPSPQYVSSPRLSSASSRYTPFPQFVPSSHSSSGYILSNRPPSTPLPPPPPQNFENIIIYQSQEPTNPAPTVNIISDERIIPPGNNVINSALMKAYEDFAQYTSA